MAKVMFISDIHGSVTATEKILAIYATEQPTQLILLGDILYHGPRNPLPESYDPKGVIALLNPMKDSIIAVRGNCDSEVDQMVLDFPIMADYNWYIVDDKRFFMTHGHLYNSQPPALLSSGDIFIQGHTHIPMIEEKGGVWHVNPGSITLPKEGHPPTYAIYEDKKITVKTFEGDCYIEKNI